MHGPDDTADGDDDGEDDYEPEAPARANKRKASGQQAKKATAGGGRNNNNNVATPFPSPPFTNQNISINRTATHPTTIINTAPSP